MTKDVHIFSPGTQTSAQGVTREFTKENLKEIASGYNSQVHEAPIRVGHQDDDKVPAWGWVKGVKMKGDALYAEVDFAPQMEQFVKDGLYKKVSASFYSPESKINPDPGKWSLRHVAMLGAQPPAVKGLKGFAYSEDEEGVFDFAVKLSPNQVFDDELGPTLKSEQSAIETLKEKLDEARTKMSQEKEQSAELEAQTKEQDVSVEEKDGQQAAFAETEVKLKVKKKAAGKMGAEDDEDEEDDDEVESKESLKGDAAKDRKMADKDVSEAKYDSKKGKKKRADSLMRDADQDNRDADEDDVNSSEDEAEHACSDKNTYADEAEVNGKMKKLGKKSADHAEGEADEDEYKQGYNDKLDDSLGAKNGKKKQDMKDRRDESEGMMKAMKKRKFSGDKQMDKAEYEEGFQQAVEAYVEALEIGGDIEFEETDETSEAFLLGVEDGFAYAETVVEMNGKRTAVGQSNDNPFASLPNEETPIAGPKTKKQPKGTGEMVDEQGDYEEPEEEAEHDEMMGKDPTFDPKNDKGSNKKRGSDGVKSSDTGNSRTAKSEVFYEEGEVESAEGDPSSSGDGRDTSKGATDEKDYVKRTAKQPTGKDGERTFGRFKVGKPSGDSGKTGRKKGGKAGKQAPEGGNDFGAADKEPARAGKSPAKGGKNFGASEVTPARSSEQTEDRNATGKAGKAPSQGGGNFGSLDHTKMQSTGGPSSKGVKMPHVRIERISSGQTPKQVAAEYSEHYSELSSRLAELEAANAKLVAEKVAAERAAHRMQLAEFTESLYAHGKLTENNIEQDELVEYMEGLEYGTLEFAEGETAATKLMEILANLPSQVTYAELAGGKSDGIIPDEALDPHDKALRMVEEGQATDYAEALKKTLFTAE